MNYNTLIQKVKSFFFVVRVKELKRINSNKANKRNGRQGYGS